MTDLHGNEPLVFDYEAAGQLVTAARSASTEIDGQSGRRSSAVTHAETDFAGFFADLFRDNARVAAADARQISVALQGLSTIASGLIRAAREEDERRATARKWYQDRENRSNMEKFGDWLTGDDDPPSSPQPPPPPKPAEVPQNSPRRTAGQGSSGGTSSARPDHLRSFASTTSSADSALSDNRTRVESLLNTFNGNTEWGQIDARPLMQGFGLWLEANANDARWARTLASAFEQAGSSGGVSTVSNAGLAAALQAAGVSAGRADLDVTMPETLGFQPTTGYSLDPVSTATGSFIELETDLRLAGPDGVCLERTYNSLDPGIGAFGHGWSSLADSRIDLDDERAVVTCADGRALLFPRLGEGWGRADGASFWLERTQAGFRMSDNDGGWWRFADSGWLIGQGTGPDSTLTLVRDGDRLVELGDRHGHRITVDWDDAHGGRIIAATTDDGRRATYDYDEHGHLCAVTAGGGTRAYGWDVEEHLLTTVTDADGVVEADNAYDERRRVRLQRTQHGRTVRFAYLPGRVTVVSDEDGTRSNTWIADQRGRLVGVVDAHDQRQSTAYDAWGNVVMVVERDGLTTVHEYDERGHRVRTVTSTGAELTYRYDEADRLVSVATSEGGLSEVAYDGEERQPARVVDAAGSALALTWEHGLLTRVVGPTGSTVVRTHDASGHLVALTDGEGHTSRFERDGAGRLVAATTPLGHRTTWSYDEAGRVVSRTDPDGAVWSWEHTAAGRTLALVDPLGGRTSIEHGDHGEPTLVTDPLGHSTRQDWDDLGNPSALTLPDGSHWDFAHDTLSRLTAVSLPDGGTWTTEHDASGWATEVTDPTGAVSTGAFDRGRGLFRVGTGEESTEVQVDPLGRLLGRTAVDGGETVLTHDRCGRVVECVDAEGGLTRFAYDAAGRIAERVAPSGATVRFAYDACDRMVAATDAAGRTTHLEYDPDGRLVRVVQPSGEESRAAYDACGRVVEASAPGVGARRWTYDGAGRVSSVTDAAHGERRFVRDSAGRVVEVVDGNGGVTRIERDARDRVVALTDPLGAVTRREYDALGHCTAETDPLGRTRRAGYDGAGRLAWQEEPDGRRTTWTRDAAGRPVSVAVDGVVRREVSIDVRARRAVVTDHTGTDARQHVLEWNGRQQLVARSRDDARISWGYDADGRRASLTTPDGSTTTYGRDVVGRITSVDHPLLGRVELDLDPDGRPVQARAGGRTQTWSWLEGFVVAHETERPDGALRTRIDRDEHGRIEAVTDVSLEGRSTHRYEHDAAGQLVALRGDGSQVTWRYDAAGRLVAEVREDQRIEHEYDAAGQLLRTTRTTGGAVEVTTHSYDEAGRRVSSTTGDRTTAYEWSDLGWLRAVVSDGRRTEVHVDALGELAAVDGVDVLTDTASRTAAVVGVGGMPVVPLGPVTGIGEDWVEPGWRTARTTDPSDPWAVPAASTPLPGLPDALRVGVGGQLEIDGLEWMGARVYDPVSRGFLSVDPLAPVAGTAWAGNPYAYAGNDPLHALDPLGLRPATDADLEAWARQHNGIGDEALAIGAVVAGGALVVLGGPAGAVIGSALIAGGIDAYSQVRSGKEFSVGELALSMTIGAATGGIGVASGAALAAGQIGRGTAMAIATGTGGVGNAGQYVGTQMIHGEDVNWGHAGVSLAIGAAGGPLGEGAGMAGSSVATRTGSDVLGNVAEHGTSFVSNTGLDAATDYATTGQIDPIKSLLAGGGNTAAGYSTTVGEHAVTSGGEPTRVTTPDGNTMTSNVATPGETHPLGPPPNDYASHYNEQRAINRMLNERAGIQ